MPHHADFLHTWLQQVDSELSVAARNPRLMDASREGIVVMPIVGTMGSERAQQVTDDLLSAVESGQVRVALLDVTGLAFVDTAVANALLRAAQAAQLLGVEPILVGVTPQKAIPSSHRMLCPHPVTWNLELET